MIDRRSARAAIRTVLLRLGSLELTTIVLLYLFVLVLAGTLYQIDHSIQDTTARFFHGWFLLVGPVPVPSGQSVFAVAGLNLLASMVTRIPLRWDRIGLWLTHVGLLLLIVGAVGSRFVVRESVLALAEGDSDEYSYDLRRWDLAVEDLDAGALRFPVEDLPPSIAGYEVRVVDYLPDASVRRDGPQRVESVTGARSIVRPQTRRDQPVPGLLADLGDRTVLLHGGDAAPLALNDGTTLRLLPRRYPLPAAIGLRRFRADFYEGTQTPRSFVSEVDVGSGDLLRPATVSMNEPLRIGAYTLYQLGYDSLSDFRNISLFHVVRNPFRVLPYVVGLLVSVGLLVHAIVHIVRRTPAAGDHR